MKKTILTAAAYLLPFLLYADPLASWTSQNSGTITNLYGLIFANGIFVAAGASGTVLSSPDGVTWSSHNPGNTNIGAGIAYDGKKYVMAGFGGAIVTSPDLVSWAQQTSGTTNLLRELAYINGSF